VGWLPRQFRIHQLDCIQAADGQAMDEGSGSSATPMPADAIATSQSHWPLCAAMRLEAGFGKAARSARVMAKSSFSSTSGVFASDFSLSVLRFFWKVPRAASAQIG
jgi:hypothetical protein